MSKNDVLLLIRFVIDLDDARLAKRHEKDHDYNKKVYILYEKQINSHSATETPTRRVVPEWASRAIRLKY